MYKYMENLKSMYKSYIKKLGFILYILIKKFFFRYIYIRTRKVLK